MGGLCKEGHDFLRICKKKNLPATLRMIDVLVTQHSKWTAKRVRRALFGQSIVDFSVDPWIGRKSRKDSERTEVRQKAKKTPSRIQREFSQSQSQASQTQRESQTETDDSSEEMNETPVEEVPNGTVYFSNNFSDGFSTFQDFSGFQYQNFQMNNHQFSTEPFQEEPIFK